MYIVVVVYLVGLYLVGPLKKLGSNLAKNKKMANFKNFIQPTATYF